MSILDGRFLIGGDMPTPTPMDTPSNVKGDLIAQVLIDGVYESGFAIGNWQLINGKKTWDRFTHPLFLGERTADPMIISGSHQVGHFYYRTSDNRWRGIFEDFGSLSWGNWNLRSALADVSARDQHAYASEELANAGLPNPIDAAHTYYAYFDGHYRRFIGLRLFDGNLYIEARDGIANAQITLPHHRVSNTHLGWVFEFSKGEEIVKSYLLVQGNDNGINGWRFEVEGVEVWFTVYDDLLDISVFDDLTTAAVDGYKFKMFIAEN